MYYSENGNNEATGIPEENSLNTANKGTVKDVVKDAWTEIKETEKDAFLKSKMLFNQLQQLIPCNKPYAEPTPLDMPSLDDIEKAVLDMYKCIDGADCHITRGQCGLTVEGFVPSDLVYPNKDGNTRFDVLYNGISEKHYSRDLSVLVEDLTWACYKRRGGNHYNGISLLKAIKDDRWNMG